jgi:hypothetical protein
VLRLDSDLEAHMKATALRVLLVVTLMTLGATGRPLTAPTQQPVAAPDTISALLVEVRGLRGALEQMATAGPRVQLALGRVQLQEQRILNQTRRLDEVSESLVDARRRLEPMTQRIKTLKEFVEMDPTPEIRRGREQELADAKGEWARLNLDVQRLTAQETALAADLAAEQNRWTDFNRLLEDLERTLAAR